MNWPNYVAHCRALNAHIGLVPLLDSPFNSGRSHTKVFDVARCGGVGVFSRKPPYDAVVRDAIDGLLLANDPRMWTEALVALAGDDASAQARLYQLSAERRLA
jgi:hypothetical protein